MMKTKPTIVSIVGARPQFIKLAPLAKGLAQSFRHYIIHTGQHFDWNMSDVFFKQLRLPKPDVNLNVGGGSHGAMTGKMLVKIEKELLEVRPDVVLVYGDTNSTLAGALAAAKSALPVGHIEAGMRSFVRDMPEEINRKLTDHLSEILFCPTMLSVKNLKAEGIRENVVLSGDVMYELLASVRPLVRKNTAILKEYDLKKKEYLFMTVHRAATVDTQEKLQQLLEAIEALPFPILFPIHPRTKKRFRQFKLWKELSNLPHLTITEPLSYYDTLALAYYAHAVLTDSGGLQKEALFLGTPVLTLREETEWEETLKLGNHLVGLDKKAINRLLQKHLSVKPIAYRIDGKKPSEIIISTLKAYVQRKKNSPMDNPSEKSPNDV